MDGDTAATVFKWVEACEATGCYPGFVAVSLCNRDGEQKSLQIPVALASLLIIQGRREACQLFVPDDNPLFKVLLADEVDRQPGEDDDEYNRNAAGSFDYLVNQLPEEQRALVVLSESFDTEVTPLGIPQMLIFPERD